MTLLSVEPVVAGAAETFLLGASVEQTISGAREAGGEIGDEPMFEGVAAVEHSVRVMRLAGDAVFVVPKPARAVACFGCIEEAGAEAPAPLPACAFAVRG